MVLGTYILNYTYTDAASNTGNTVTRMVMILPDATPPVVTLSGSANIVLIQGSTYTEQ